MQELRHRFRGGDQGSIITVVLVFVILVAWVMVDKFGSATNILNVLRSVSTLGIIAVGMSVVVVARGLDLSIVAIMGVTSAFVVQYVVNGGGEVAGLTLGLVMALFLGFVNGLLVAYAEIPPLFVTLATPLLFLGTFVILYVSNTIVQVPAEAKIMTALGRDSIADVPYPVVLFAIITAGAAWLMSHNLGRFLYAQGDNPAAARLAGFPVRPLTVSTYVFSALAGFIGGVSLVSVAGGYDLQTVGAGILLYDVIAVVVIGGVSLAGGRGTILGVVAATILIGVIENVMTLLNFDTIQQSLAKAFIVLFVIVLDSWLHPRNEETARVGDL